jgi:G2/mitotic-specific cyclin 3/4
MCFLQLPNTFKRVQIEITLSDHSELVDWMAEVVEDQQLQTETLFLAVHLMDSVLKLKPIKKSSFQLLGATCIFVASKLEEIQARNFYIFRKSP